ncbi:MAG: type II secretion system protein [Clostridium sp.]|nr:type II secretion system protein [Clostridium sp.]
MLKKQKGITLIALVVTIVVLLILAGVTISLLLDENGIITKSKDARTETRVSQIEDEVGMWKQHNFINKESNQAQESADTMLENLISRKLLTEDEIDRDQELITIKKKDGTVIKEISYSNVTINISKTPATEKTGAVLLKVDSVEGLNSLTITSEEELNTFVNSLSEDQKKEIIRNGYIKFVNKQDPSANCTTFQDVLEWTKKQGNISEATEDAFWTVLLSKQGLDEATLFVIKSCYYNESTKMIEGYTITNPNNEESNTYYIAKANGTYTFRIKDVVTGKTYTKKVEVTNVDTSLQEYTVASKKNDNNYVAVMLKSEATGEYTNFEKAYIMYNNEKIEITSVIYNDEDRNTSVISTADINRLLYNEKITTTKRNLEYTNQTIILVKDNKVYIGLINMGNVTLLE